MQKPFEVSTDSSQDSFTKIKGMFLNIGKVFVRIFLVIFFLQLAYMIVLKWVDPPITVTQIVSWAEGYGIKKDYVKLKDMSINAQLAAIAGEDTTFLEHHGFNFKRIEIAIWHYHHHTPQEGSSTLSQQVAKNVFLWQKGGFLRKGIETYLTIMILEVYLNVIEMGDGVFGIEAASQHYFHKSAKDLTQQEAAIIVSYLPNPRMYSEGKYPAIVASRLLTILFHMKKFSSQPIYRQFLGMT